MKIKQLRILFFVFLLFHTASFASQWSPTEVSLDCTGESGGALTVNLTFSEDQNPAYEAFPMFGLVSVEEYFAFLFITQRPNKDIYAYGAATIDDVQRTDVAAFVDRQTGRFELVQLDGNRQVIDVYFVGTCANKANRLF